MVPYAMGGLGNTIDLLYVDDDDILLTMTKAYLERTGYYSVQTASSANEALCMIHENAYDAVVSDYQMPEMDGIEFLKSLRAQGITIPFIIFTGRGREEVAIEALNAGADYYLQKGGQAKVQFGKLQNFIRKAVEKNRAEKRVLEHEQRMADIIDFLPDATFAVDADGGVIAWNRAIEQMTGVPSSEILGTDDYASFLPFRGGSNAILTDILLNRGGRTSGTAAVQNAHSTDILCAETFIPHHCGGGMHLWSIASPLYDADGNVTGAIESIRDITYYKQAEGLYKTVFENTGTAMMIIEEDTTILHVNGKMEEIWGYSREESEGRLRWPDLVAKKDREVLLNSISLWKKDLDLVPNHYECGLIHRSGEIKSVYLTVAFIPGTTKCVISIIDITLQKEAEKELKLNHFTIDNAADAIFLVDSEQKLISVNRRAIDLFGYSREEFLSKGLSWFFSDYRPECFRKLWARAERGEHPLFETRILRKDDGYVDVEISLVVLDYQGQKYGCGFARDLTKRKAAERALRENEIMYREIVNGASDIIFLNEFTPETGPGRFIEVNDAMCRNLGYTREELLGMSLMDISSPETNARFGEIAEEFRKRGRATFEAGSIGRNGMVITHETNATAFPLNGRMVFLSVGRDVSGQKEAEKALRESETKFREIFNSANDLIILSEFSSKRGPGRIIEVNDAVCRTMGYTREELFGMSLMDFGLPEAHRMTAEFSRWFSEAGKAMLEIRAIKKDGSMIIVETNELLFMLDGRPVHLCIGRDVTERRAAEFALKTLNKKLTLLSSITRHDINNQISVLMGYEELLGRGIDDEKYGGYLAAMGRATKMIRDQIAFTRTYQELGAHTPAWQSVESVVRSMMSHFSENDVAVRIDTGTLEIFADPMLEKVFYNLFENAVTHGGHVTDISVTFHETEGGGILLIEDNGEGVAAGMKDTVFMRGIGKNNGFGLFLTREILDITGIGISETGTEGTGARFEIVVPDGGYRFMDES